MPPLLHRQAEAGRLGRPHRPVRTSLRPAQEVVVASAAPERSAALYDVRLAAIVARHFGVEQTEASPFPGGAARTADRAAWVFVDADPIRSLGPCLAWARQHDIDALHLVVEQDAGVLTRRASQFVDPPTVWWLRDSELQPVEPEPVQSAPRPGDAPDLVAMLVDAGLDVVAEHGHHAGEWRGLEVARVSEGRLEVGVGSADRELTALVHAGLLPRDALARAVAIVRDERRPGVARHPLNQLVPERWLRWTVCRHPERIGLDRLDPVASPVPRRGMRERDVAVAHAPGHVVVCSVGIDLDLVPAAADARLVIEPDAELVLVVPERDAHHTTRALAAALSRPADVRPFVGDWRL